MSSFFEEKALHKNPLLRLLLEVYGKTAAKRCLLQKRIEIVKNNFFEKPWRFTDEEFLGSGIDELFAQEQKFFQQILQIDSELRRRRTQ